ncbi:MAG: hypothetical protein JNL21_16245 [Myxococcales bacterium]|nr:hypothetical protein [Myxococcales bacterium]
MSDEQDLGGARKAEGAASASDDKADQKAKPRKIARSASTAERASAAPAGEGEAAAPASGEEGSRRKWDVRAERPEGAPRPARPRPGRPHARFESDLAATTRRPGASGGRAMPTMPERGPVDKSSPDFVDRWLSRPARKPEDGPRKPREDRRERRGRPEGRPEGRPAAAAPKLEAKPAAAAAPPQPKLPTLHETILVGLPRVAAQRQIDKSQNKPKTAKEALAAKAASGAPKPKAEPAKGEVVLDPSWVSANGDNAVSVLRGAGPAAEALVDAWLSASNVEAIAAAGASEELSGAARKASRRALGVLKARGVAIPERTTAASAGARSGEEEVIEATFSPPDGRGTISFTIAKRRGGERAHIAEVIARDGVGVVNAVSGWMSRSQIKEAHQRIADSTGVPPATVPAEWARYRIAQAKAENAKSGALVPLSLERCKELIDPTPAAEPTHPVADLESSIGDAAEAPASLHAEPELRSWLPDGRALDELLRKVGEKLSAADAEDSKKVDEVLQEEVKLATDRFFTPEQRALLARRMRDAAISVRQRAGEDRAKDLLRAVKAIESAGLITSPPSELEFLRVFFQKGLSVLAQQQGGLRVPVAAQK